MEAFMNEQKPSGESSKLNIRSDMRELLHESFEKFDVDHSNTLSSFEFLKCLNDIKADDMNGEDIERCLMKVRFACIQYFAYSFMTSFGI